MTGRVKISHRGVTFFDQKYKSKAHRQHVLTRALKKIESNSYTITIIPDDNETNGSHTTNSRSSNLPGIYSNTGLLYP